MSNRIFAVVTLAVAFALAAVTQLISNDYFFSAAYTVLLFVILHRLRQFRLGRVLRDRRLYHGLFLQRF